VCSDSLLRRWYNKYNAEFFGGELPDEVQVIWEACAAHGEAYQIQADAGEILFGIRINPHCRTLWKGGRQGWARLTLIHEMIHVKLWDSRRRLRSHGSAFDNEIARLCQFRSYRALL
jgi:predicted SprT family Zn-dependent metalloprotease